MQFLVRMTNQLPPDFPEECRKQLVAAEQKRSRELSEGGKLVAHWKVPLKHETITLWEVSGQAELHELVMSLPAAAWASASVTPLVPRNLHQHASNPPGKIA
ncbi:muconolactone D-isomerase [Sphingobium sp. JAI105]|uniref:muconolactone Delta-isomerase n=1 Tax=Sphingobium sp. JAI105 TaxID=2787715 RepID=UPI0018CBAC90|nr:muconolactone Delta-isomerase family protein [Sphingobium sp. JAI105]MBG6118492.1 muconolactone D-isomerase [Sphingobium sp. JAI105]